MSEALTALHFQDLYFIQGINKLAISFCIKTSQSYSLRK